MCHLEIWGLATGRSFNQRKSTSTYFLSENCKHGKVLWLMTYWCCVLYHYHSIFIELIFLCCVCFYRNISVPYLLYLMFRRDSWNQLLVQIETRQEKLRAASQLHRFSRDVTDALDRIQVRICVKVFYLKHCELVFYNKHFSYS